MAINCTVRRVLLTRGAGGSGPRHHPPNLASASWPSLTGEPRHCRWRVVVLTEAHPGGVDPDHWVLEPLEVQPIAILLCKS